MPSTITWQVDNLPCSYFESLLCCGSLNPRWDKLHFHHFWTAVLVLLWRPAVSWRDPLPAASGELVLVLRHWVSYSLKARHMLPYDTHKHIHKCEKHWTRTPFVSYSHLGMAVRWSGFSQQCEGSGIWSELPPWTAGRRSPYRAKHSEPPPVSRAIAAYLSRDKRKDQEFCLWDLLLQFRVGSVILCQSLKSAF